MDVDSIGTRTRPVRAGWAPVPALAVGAFAIGTDIHVMVGVVGDLAADLGVPAGAAGLAATVFALGYATGAPLLSAAVATRPPRSILIGALALSGLFAVLSALAPTLPMLLATRVLGALAASVYVPAAGAAAVAAVPEDRRGRALGTLLAGASTATVLGAPLGVLLASALSWRAAFGLVGLLAAAGVLCVLRSDLRTAPPARVGTRERLRPVRDRRVLGLLGVTFLMLTASSSVFTYLGLIVETPARLALAVAVFGLAGVAGTFWGGAAADRFGGRRVVATALVTLVLAFAALPLAATSPGAAPAVVAAWGLACWAIVPAQQHRLLGLRAGVAPILLALHTCAIHLGFAAGSLLGGIAVHAGGPLWMLAVAACGAGLALHAAVSRKDL